MCVVPIVIGLRIVDISLYNDFIHGKNPKPLIDILDTEEFSDWVVSKLLRNDESLKSEANMKQVTNEQKITEMYKAIFVTDSTIRHKTETLGQYQFDGNLKDFIISASGMFSNYADFEV